MQLVWCRSKSVYHSYFFMCISLINQKPYRNPLIFVQSTCIHINRFRVTTYTYASTPILHTARLPSAFCTIYSTLYSCLFTNICFYVLLFYIAFVQRPILFCSCVSCLLQQCLNFPQGITEVILPYLFYMPTHLCRPVILLYGHQRAMHSTSAGDTEHEKAVARK